MDQVASYISDTLVEKFGVPTGTLTPDTRFEALDIDSLVLIELTVILEGRFGVTIKEGELNVDQTIAEAATLVSAKGAG